MKFSLLLIGGLLLAPSLHAGGNRIIQGDYDRYDTAAINLNFTDFRNELLNVVHKTSTETIRGFKYFTNKVDFTNIEADALAVSGTSTLQGPVVISSSIGIATPGANTMYSEYVPIAMGYITVSGGTPSETYGVNISSITDGGVGIYGVNFDRDAATTNYVCLATPADSLNEAIVATRTTADIYVNLFQAQTGAAIDGNFTIICYGNH